MTNDLDMQNCRGDKPNGLVAVEVQEWVRTRLLTTIHEKLRGCCCKRGHAPWLQYGVYEGLCTSVGREVSSMIPEYLVAMDWDARHTSNYLWEIIDAVVSARAQGLPPPPHLPKPIDRRLIPKGQEGWIPFDAVHNQFPSAARMPDTVQFPIESLFAQIKRDYWKILATMPDDSPASMVRAIKEAFSKCATIDQIQRNWAHAEKSLRVFCGKRNTTVRIDGKDVHCTEGNWVPAKFRG